MGPYLFNMTALYAVIEYAVIILYASVVGMRR